MVLNVTNLSGYFEEILSPLQCDDATKAYIISIYLKYKHPQDDLSKCSITLRFAQAKEKQDFYEFQNIGDWIFFSKTLFPTYCKVTNLENYYDNIAQLSYYSCYRMVRSWKLYEQLADEYLLLTNQAKNLLKSK